MAAKLLIFYTKVLWKLTTTELLLLLVQASLRILIFSKINIFVFTGSTSDLPGIRVQEAKLKHCPHFHMVDPSKDAIEHL